MNTFNHLATSNPYACCAATKEMRLYQAINLLKKIQLLSTSHVSKDTTNIIKISLSYAIPHRINVAEEPTVGQLF
jgi:hypothetical protein